MVKTIITADNLSLQGTALKKVQKPEHLVFWLEPENGKGWDLATGWSGKLSGVSASSDVPSGRTGYSYFFDGVDDTIRMGYYYRPNVMDMFNTVSHIFWAKGEGRAWWSGRYGIDIYPSYVRVYTSTEQNIYLDFSTSIDTSQWNHFMVVINEDDRTVKLYVNNTLIDTKDIPSNSETRATEIFYIGGTGNKVFDGYIYDYRVYKTDMSGFLEDIYSDSDKSVAIYPVAVLSIRDIDPDSAFANINGIDYDRVNDRLYITSGWDNAKTDPYSIWVMVFDKDLGFIEKKEVAISGVSNKPRARKMACIGAGKIAFQDMNNDVLIFTGLDGTDQKIISSINGISTNYDRMGIGYDWTSGRIFVSISTKVYYTDDYGDSWTEIPLTIGCILADIIVIDKDNIIVVGDRFIARFSYSNGEWVLSYRVGETNPSNASFLHPYVPYDTVGEGIYYKTSSDGIDVSLLVSRRAPLSIEALYPLRVRTGNGSNENGWAWRSYSLGRYGGFAGFYEVIPADENGRSIYLLPDRDYMYMFNGAVDILYKIVWEEIDNNYISITPASGEVVDKVWVEGLYNYDESLKDDEVMGRFWSDVRIKYRDSSGEWHEVENGGYIGSACQEIRIYLNNLHGKNPFYKAYIDSITIYYHEDYTYLYPIEGVIEVEKSLVGYMEKGFTIVESEKG